MILAVFMKGHFKKTTFVMVGALAVGFLLWEMLRPQEPAYQGKRLSAWLRVVGSSVNLVESNQAREAVKEMGTNALPTLIRMLGTRESLLKSKLRPASLRYPLVRRFYIPRADPPGPGLWWIGFRILGPSAKPAVPQLIEMLGTEDDLIRSRVASSLEAIGPVAFPELLEAYRTRTGRVNSGAATVLYSIDLQAALNAGVK